MTGAECNGAFLLTPAGAGAIALIRLVGPGASAILGAFFRAGPAHEQTSSAGSGDSLAGLAENRLRYGQFVAEGELIDEVMVCRLMVDGHVAFDISAHGGTRIVERILQALERRGAPLLTEASLRVSRQPAEWNKPTLIESEALSLLCAAKTERAVRFLAWQHQHLVRHIRESANRINNGVDDAAEVVAVLTRGYPTARVLVDGARVVLVGPPNSGKSTLFNGLIGRASTVVSPRPGTTRDWVSSTFELQGAPLTLIDTAGRHEGCDALEECAIESGKTVAGAADLLVVVVDGSAESSCGDAWLRSLSATDRGILQVINKMDQISPHSVTMGCSSPSLGNEPPIHVSARTGAGIEELVTKIAEKLELSTPVDRRPCLFTGRQRLCAEKLLSDRVRSPQDAAARLCCGLLGE